MTAPPTPDPAAVKALFALLLDADDPESAEDADPVAAAQHELDHADPAVRRAAEALLAAHRRARGLLEEPDSSPRGPHHDRPTDLPSTVPNPGVPAITPPVIEGYEVGDELGRGGFGVVFAARQLRPVERDVAVKILRAEFSTPETAARFRAEAAVLARMNHDGVARVLDAGLDHAGRPFVSMERIRGEPLTTYCRSRTLPLRARLDLMARVCDAVHHAHQRAVIHRDLKPANILIEDVDGSSRPRVIDFGIAKLLDDSSAGGDHVTREGVRLGTPRYMSPEQRTGEETSDVRIDVYALGVLLCELLTGAVPHGTATPGTSGEDSGSRRRSKATRPSQLAANVESPAAAPRELRGDLDRIVLKAVADDLALRYRSAAALGDDIRRYLEGRPVDATPPGAVYLTRRFLGRHKAASALVLIAVTSAVAGAVALKHGRDEAEQGRAIAEDALHKSETARQRSDAVVSFLLGDMLDAIGPDNATRSAFTIQDFLRGTAAAAESRLSSTPDVLIDVLERVGESLTMLTDSAEGWETYSAAADVAAREHGESDPETLRLRLEAALARRWANISPEANREVLALRDRIVTTLGPEHPIALRARTYGIMIESPADPRDEMHTIGQAYERQGLAGSQGHLELLQYLGFALEGLGDPAASEQFRRALDTATAALGPQHSKTMSLRHAYAKYLLSKDKLDEARTVIDEQIALAQPMFGVPNRFRAYGLQMACELAVQQERFTDMLPYAEEYQAAIVELHGQDSIQSSTAGHWLARAQAETGHHGAAAATYAWVVPARAQAWGQSRATVLDDRLRWAWSLLASGQPDKVEAAVTPGIEHAEQGSVIQARLIVAFADALLAQGHPPETVVLVDLWLAKLPDDAPGRPVLQAWRDEHPRG